MMNNMTLIANNTIQFTIVEPLIEDEIMEIISSGNARGIDVSVVHSGRIVVMEHDDIREAINILGDANVVELIGLIRQIIEYDIVHDDNTIQVTLET